MPGRRTTDPKTAYTKEQLAEIGAIALVWNHVNDFVDWLLHICLGSPMSILWALGRSIGSVERKLDLLTLVASRSHILNDEARECIRISFSAILEYQKYRDHIVHSTPYNVDLGIAHSMDRRANPRQSLVTMEALSALYERMKILLDELPEIDLLFRLSSEDGARQVYWNTEDPVARRRNDVPWQVARCRERQKIRLDLPPLPHFPEEP
jgi:hypothetical protein